MDKDSPSVVAKQKFLGKRGLRLDVIQGVNGHDLFGSEYSYVYDEAVQENVTYRRDPQTGELTLKGQAGFLTAGERGYRGSMRKLFARLILTNVVGNVLVLDEDALFKCNFETKLRDLLAVPRCGNHVLHT
jgi:hypothetical protein